MKEHIINSYENSLEETRLTSNNARRIEFLNTTRILDELLGENQKILDCAAGTGIYAFYLADKGHDVTATDLTPRHVEVINQTLAEKSYDMTTAVMDATDMGRFADETFDVVLNMGPFYHLTCETQRQKCLAESIRVLKKGGLLLTAYIPRFYVFQYVALSNKHFLDARLAQQIVTTGVLHHDDEKCFWTDTYYATKEEMEQLYGAYGLDVTDHFAQDGLTPTFAATVDNWTEEEFKIWCDYHYSVCREESLLGASNHVIIAGRK
ncbi:MAG: class I SAM-dependent methyltransferase [Lachnospiraceae bacterium]|nr:class I SAM-dependent methyltransferase [Lachnospiraceae bacterium]